MNLIFFSITEALTILVEKADDPTDQLFVFYPDDEKVYTNIDAFTICNYLSLFIRWA